MKITNCIAIRLPQSRIPLVGITLLFLTALSFAGVDAVLLEVSVTNSYIVPTGKVLVIENLLWGACGLAIESEAKRKVVVRCGDFGTCGPDSPSPPALTLPL